MKQRQSSREESATIGLCWLIEHFHLPAAMPATRSQLALHGRSSIRTQDDATRQLPRYYLPNGWISHLRFALRYEPVALDAYFALFRVLNKHRLTKWIQSHPQSLPARRAWYLYELLLHERLEIPDVIALRYVDLLDPSLHVTGPRRKIERQRIYDNLLGCGTFSPLVRRTAHTNALLDQSLAQRADSAAGNCPPSVLAGAVHSLFLKFCDLTTAPAVNLAEDDTERLVSTVMRSAGIALAEKEGLIQAHNSVVSPNHAEKDWRRNDLPGHPSVGNEEVSPAFARSNDIDILMNDWMEFVRSVEEVDSFNTVVMAAVAACALLVIRPFTTGNRRMHVLVIHHLLSILQFTSPGTLCPVSAATLKNHDEYRKALSGILGAIQSADCNRLNAAYVIHTDTETAHLYRYFDATPFVEYVAQSIETLLDDDLPQAIRFFATFGSAFRSLPGTVPTQRAEILVRELLQRNGNLSKTERAKYADIPGECLTRMERLVFQALNNGYDPQWSI